AVDALANHRRAAVRRHLRKVWIARFSALANRFGAPVNSAAIPIVPQTCRCAMNTNDWNDAERRVERAAELFEQRKWQEALAELLVATTINPYNGGWFFNIGLTLDEMGRLDEAIDAYGRALAIDPRDVQALTH